MAQVAIVVNGSSHPKKTQLAATLAVVLGCPVLTPAKVQETLLQQVGPVAPRPAVLHLADETIWQTAGLIEAGVVIDGSWGPGDRESVGAGLALAGNPRVVEVWCEGAGREEAPTTDSAEPIDLAPVVRVDISGEVNMDSLVVVISRLFV